MSGYRAGPCIKMTLSVKCANKKRKKPHPFCLIFHSWKGGDSPCLQPGKKNLKGTLTLEPRYCILSKEHDLKDDDDDDDDITPSDGEVQ